MVFEFITFTCVEEIKIEICVCVCVCVFVCVCVCMCVCVNLVPSMAVLLGSTLGQMHIKIPPKSTHSSGSLKAAVW